ncbi:MAG: hypothetical protein ACOC44_12350 [Promethearchaeia archaeon]
MRKGCIECGTLHFACPEWLNCVECGGKLRNLTEKENKILDIIIGNHPIGKRLKDLDGLKLTDLEKKLRVPKNSTTELINLLESVINFIRMGEYYTAIARLRYIIEEIEEAEGV